MDGLMSFPEQKDPFDGSADCGNEASSDVLLMQWEEFLREEEEKGVNAQKAPAKAVVKAPEYYHVRVNPKRTAVMKDFDLFFAEMIRTRYGTWDKDSKNKMVAGDYLGFITGPVGEEEIYIYRIKGEGTAEERPSHWASTTPYTSNNGKTSVAERQTIILTNKHTIPKTYDWRKFRKDTGLGCNCTSWMPRGTQRVDQTKWSLPFEM